MRAITRRAATTIGLLAATGALDDRSRGPGDGGG